MSIKKPVPELSSYNYTRPLGEVSKAYNEYRDDIGGNWWLCVIDVNNGTGNRDSGINMVPAVVKPN